MLHSVPRSYALDIKLQKDYNMLKKWQSCAVKYIQYQKKKKKIIITVRRNSPENNRPSPLHNLQCHEWIAR